MRRFIVVISFIFTAFILSACAGSGDTTSENTSNNDDAGQQKDLTIDLESDPVSLDPHGANDGNSLYVMNAMYDSLVEMNTDLEIEPGLAESLEQKDDTVWEAKLREDVTFHDGSELDAEVVKANLERVIDPDIASPLAFLFDMIESVEAEDEYTVLIETEYPFPALPYHLAHPGGHIMSEEAIEDSYDAVEQGDEPFEAVNENPIGTGYFELDDWVNGEYVELEKNDDYWGEEPKMETMTFKTVQEDSARIAELQTGEADIIYPVNANDVEQVDSDEDTKVEQSDSSNLSYMGMNNEKEPFDDKKVRKAISMAIDNEELIEGVLDGVPIPAEGPLAPTVNGYSDDIDPIGFDPEETEELLAEAGYEDGFEMSILTNDRTTADTAENIQSQLSEIGIDASIEQVETGAYLEETADGNFDAFVGSWGTVTLDADYGLYPMFHSENKGESGNRSFFDNDEVDSLLEEARQETDESKRMALYEEAQQMIVDEAPIVPLYHSVLLAGLDDSIEGFFQYPSSFPYLRDVEFK